MVILGFDMVNDRNSDPTPQSSFGDANILDCSDGATAEFVECAPYPMDRCPSGHGIANSADLS